MTFATLKKHVDAAGGGLDEIREAYGCGRGCAMCVPYIEAMLRTGETTFPVELPPDPPGQAARELDRPP